MELQHFSHQHPLVFNEEPDRESEQVCCSGCGELVSGPSFGCVQCGFYLDKQCAEAPSEMNHPFHRDHSFHLLSENHPRGIVYSCSLCKFTLHIQCSTIQPQPKINQPSHRKHPLILQIVNECLPCQICEYTTDIDDIVYFCSICKFVLHIECASSPTVIKDKLQNVFILVQRPAYFCDACGTSGNFVPYFCSTSNLLVHQNCISLPRNIKFFRHEHILSHVYFLEQHEEQMRDCGVCYEEVNTEYGSYFCSKCNYTVHVNCATKSSFLYHEVESIETEEATDLDERLDLIETVTSTWIKHSWHQHNLTLSVDIPDFKQCDACILPIGTSFYHCSQCDFSLHKACAELPLKKHIWFNTSQKPLTLSFKGIFMCVICEYETSGFGYRDESGNCICLRCSLLPDITRCEDHEHNLVCHLDFEPILSCNACGGSCKLRLVV